MANIDTIFPPDPEMTEEKIENELNRPNHIARILAGGAVAASASVAVYKIWRRYPPYNGIDHE